MCFYVTQGYLRRSSIVANSGGCGQGKNLYILEKAFARRFVLDASESGSFVSCQRQSNGRCPRDVIICASLLVIVPLFIQDRGMDCLKGVYIISAWVSGVARFDKMGDARASMRETSNSVRTLTLFFLYIVIEYKHLTGES